MNTQEIFARKYMTSTNFLMSTPLANSCGNAKCFLKEMVSFAKLLKTPQQTSFVETRCKNVKNLIFFTENQGGLKTVVGSGNEPGPW